MDILISGYHDSPDPWTEREALSLLPQAVGPPVLPGPASTDRVCAYDRPETVRYIPGVPLTDRGTPVAQPRTAAQLVDELHRLLASAGVPQPYVLAADSLGGLVALLYARTYPEQVRGIVFVNAFSPTLPDSLGPLWSIYRDKLLNPPAANQPVAAPSLRDRLGTEDRFGGSADRSCPGQRRRARTMSSA